MDRKKIRLFALLAALTCLASGCSKDEEKEEPHTLREYALGGQAGQTVAALQPEEENVQGVKDLTQVYRYSGLENAGATVAAYVDLLTDSENGFSVVDADFVRTEKPDFTLDAGTVRLARRLVLEEETTEPQEQEKEDKKEKEEDSKEQDSQDEAKADSKEEKDDQGEQSKEGEEDKAEAPPTEKVEPKKWLVTVQIDWRAGNCVVTVDQKEGSITSPKKKASAASAPVNMTLMEAIDHFKGLSPAALGLDAPSMDAYQIQSLDGVIMVDGMPCMKMRVYDTNTPEGTNELKGNFLMTSDGAHIYELDEVNRTVREIQMNNTPKAE